MRLEPGQPVVFPWKLGLVPYHVFLYNWFESTFQLFRPRGWSPQTAAFN